MYNLHPLPTTGSERSKRVTSRWHEPVRHPSHPCTSEGYTVCGCGLDLAATRERGMRNDVEFENKPVDECLLEMESTGRRMKFDIFLKCFQLYGPRGIDKLKEVGNHCGAHTVIIEECIQSYSFQPMLKDCHERACELWRTRNVINAVCCCSQGIHRSVAIAYIMSSVFALKGYRAIGPYHLSKSNFQRYSICKDCPECKPNEQKEELVKLAASRW